MRPITKTVYQAFDGSEHDTAAAARAHEKEHAHLAIVGLTLEEALAIAAREDVDRADAVEALGKSIERKRLDAGERRRRPSEAKAPEPEAQPEPAGAPPPPPAQAVPLTMPGGLWPPAKDAAPAEPDDDAGSEADALTA